MTSFLDRVSQWYVPRRRLVLRSPLSDAELLGVFAKLIEEPSFGTWFFGGGSRPLYGRVSGRCVRARVARRSLMAQRDRPVLTAEIEPLSGGARIVLALRLGTFQQVFFLVWSGALTAIAAFLVGRMVILGEVPWLLAVPFVLGMLSVGFWMNGFGFEDDWQFIQKLLRENAKAEPVESVTWHAMTT